MCYMKQMYNQVCDRLAKKVFTAQKSQVQVKDDIKWQTLINDGRYFIIIVVETNQGDLKAAVMLLIPYTFQSSDVTVK